MGAVDYTIVGVYLTAIVILGVLLQKRASSGIESYFLGNRGMPWWALGASGMASNLDVTGTMINTAWIFALGAVGMFIEIRGGVTLIMAFLMIFMGKWNRRAHVMTMAEWMKFRFGEEREGNVARLISAFSIILMTIAMITYFAVGSGKFISTFLGIPDIGRVKNGLNVQEIDSISGSMEVIKGEKERLATFLDEQKIGMTESKALEKRWTDLETSWTSLSSNGESLKSLIHFEKELHSFSTTAKSMRWLLESEDPQHTTADRMQASGMEALGNSSESIRTLFMQAAEYEIVIKAQFIAAVMMITLAMIYTVASGLYGVVWTDVFQGILIFGTIIFICVMAFTKFNIPEVFSISVPMKDGTFQAIQTTRDAWTGVVPPWKLHFPAGSTYSIYNLFGLAIFFYLIKVAIEGSGGTSGYMIQRYFASRSDRDAGLLSLFWTFLLSFRWPFIAAIAIMGVSLGATQGVISDPETVLPVVVNQLIPIGIKGLLVAGLMAAAMSTFDSTVNAGAAYWVKDIYQAFINPKASEKKLMRHSRVASILIVVFGLLFSLTIKNINEIWGWITMSISAGMIIPTLVRWYWWRLNGYGFAIGTAAGMITAIVQRLIFPDVPEYVSFSLASGMSLIFMILATYITRPTKPDVLDHFYKKTRPFGLWKPVRAKIALPLMEAINKENRRDIISIFMAVPWQIVLFLMWIMVIMKRWDYFGILLGLLIVLSVGLYFTWYRHLSTEVKVED